MNKIKNLNEDSLNTEKNNLYKKYQGKILWCTISERRYLINDISVIKIGKSFHFIAATYLISDVTDLIHKTTMYSFTVKDIEEGKELYIVDQ